MSRPKYKAKDVARTDNNRFNISESFKVVRTNIMFSLLNQGCKKIVISSSMAGEGKTTTAVHIAVSLAQMNSKVILLDTDFRKPKVNQFFHLDSTPGLTNFLGHMADFDNIVQRTDYPTLSVICAGATVPNPSEMLASAGMSQILAKLENQYDYIVMDTPPLNIVVDAMQLIKQSDGVVLVVRASSSTYPELNRTIKGLEMVDAKILGFVLNGVDRKEKMGYRYGYGKYDRHE